MCRRPAAAPPATRRRWRVLRGDAVHDVQASPPREADAERGAIEPAAAAATPLAGQPTSARRDRLGARRGRGDEEPRAVRVVFACRDEVASDPLWRRPAGGQTSFRRAGLEVDGDSPADQRLRCGHVAVPGPTSCPRAGTAPSHTRGGNRAARLPCGTVASPRPRWRRPATTASMRGHAATMSRTPPPRRGRPVMSRDEGRGMASARHVAPDARQGTTACSIATPGATATRARPRQLRPGDAPGCCGRRPPGRAAPRPAPRRRGARVLDGDSRCLPPGDRSAGRTTPGRVARSRTARQSSALDEGGPVARHAALDETPQHPARRPGAVAAAARACGGARRGDRARRGPLVARRVGYVPGRTPSPALRLCS